MVPGVHVPPHADPVQTNVQVVGVPQAPDELHSACWVPLVHSVVPGAHTPPHADPVQTKGHVVGVSQVADALHSCC